MISSALRILYLQSGVEKQSKQAPDPRQDKGGGAVRVIRGRIRVLPWVSFAFIMQHDETIRKSAGKNPLIIWK